jgi:hypothetical protein
VLAVLLGVGAGALVNITTGGGDGSESRTGAPGPERVDAPTTTDPGSLPNLADAVEVVETGFTTGSREYCRNSADQDTSDGCYGCSVAEGCATRPPQVDHLVSIGVIVRNDSDHLLKQIPLTITFADDAGQPINLSSGDGETEIGRLLPGEQLGLGDIMYLESGGTTAMAVEVGHPGESLSVDFAQATADLAGLYELTVSEVRVSDPGSLDADGRPTEWSVRFQLDGSLPDGLTSGYERDRLSARPHAVYRDSNNRIIGGNAGQPMEIDAVALGNAEIRVDNDGLPFPAIDTIKTEVYFTDFGVE